MTRAFYWHIHHDTLLEAATEPIANRIDFIKKNKPEHEIDTRLRLLHPVVAPLPAELSKADAEWSKADAEWRKAYAELRKAYAEWSKADAELRKAYAELRKAEAEWSKAYAEWRKAEAELRKAEAECAPAIEALHLKECPNCPWNGETIFP